MEEKGKRGVSPKWLCGITGRSFKEGQKNEPYDFDRWQKGRQRLRKNGSRDPARHGGTVSCGKGKLTNRSGRVRHQRNRQERGRRQKRGSARGHRCQNREGHSSKNRLVYSSGV